jgi:hypothetical protein
MRTKHNLFPQTLLGLALLASSSVAAVDPALVALAPPDTKAFVGIQVDQAQSSALGRFLLAQADPDTGLQQFAALTGFDPRRDLSQILIASNGKQGAQGGALILGRGTFQPDKLTAAATLAGAKKVTYSGIDLLTSKDSVTAGIQTMAFLNSSTVMIGDVSGLKSAIDRYRSGTSFGGSLAQRASEVSALYQAWFVAASVDELANNFGAGGNAGGIPTNAFQSILTAAGGLKLASDAVTIALDAVTRTDKDAQSLVDVVKFLAGMVHTGANDNPNAARAATLVDSASITSTGPTMHISMAIPEKDVEQMLFGSQRKGRN